MTNSEVIKSMRNLDDLISITKLEHESVRMAISALEENAKLKAEIEQLKGELKSEREFRANARIELLDRKTEIEQLKLELEQSYSCNGCKHDFDRNEYYCDGCKRISVDNFELKGKVENDNG